MITPKVLGLAMLVVAPSACLGPPKNIHLKSMNTQGRTELFTVGQRVGEACGRKTPLNVMEMNVNDMKAAKKQVADIFATHQGMPLRSGCEFYNMDYKLKGFLGKYDEVHNVTRWVSARSLKIIERELRALGDVEYADVHGFLGDAEDISTQKSGQVNGKTISVAQKISAFNETNGMIPLHVILVRHHNPPPEDDPVAIVARLLEHSGIVIDKNVTMVDKLQALFDKAGAVKRNDFVWCGGWAYRIDKPDLGVGVSIARVNGDESGRTGPGEFKLVANYGPELLMPLSFGSADALKGPLNLASDQFGFPKFGPQSVVFEYRFPSTPPQTHPDVYEMRKIEDKAFVVKLDAKSPFWKSAFILLYKDLSPYYDGL